MQRFWPLLCVLLLLSLVIESKFIFFPTPNTEQGKIPGLGAQSPPNPAKKALKVKILVLKPDTLSSQNTALGSIKAWESVDLYPEQNGRLSKILVKDGQQVHQGQILAELQNADLLAAVNKIQTQLKWNLRKWERSQKLFHDHALSQEDWDNIQALVEQNRAELAQAQALIQKTQIRAPFSGILGLRQLSLGAMLNPQTKVFSLVDPSQYKVDFNVPQNLAQNLLLGQNVQIQVGNKNCQAQIVAKELSLDTLSRSQTLRAKLIQCPQALPGSFAQIQIRQLNPQAILIPSQALSADLKGTKVWLYQGGKAKSVYVQTGIRTNQNVEILQGLKAGDSLIQSQLMALKPEQAVEILPSQGGTRGPKLP